MRYCCQNCFSNTFLRHYIRKNGHKGNCSYCGAEGKSTINPRDLRDLFEPVISLYEPVEIGVHFESYGETDASDFETLGDLLDDDWGVFSNQLDHTGRDSLLDDIYIRKGREGDGIYDTPPSDPWAKKDDRIWSVTPEQTWRWFADEVKVGNLDKDFTSDESGELTHPITWVDSAIYYRNAIRLISPRTVLFRGRPGHHPMAGPQTELKPWPPDQMHAPPADKTTRGRVNRAGERVFYAAFDPCTALCEAGREPGTLVSVRQVASVRHLRVADLTKFHGITQPFGVSDLESIDIHSRLLQQLNIELSRRVSDSDANIDYLPTQMLADAIKHEGYDGICFRSSRNPGGTNLVVFNPSDMRVFTRGKVASVNSVPHDFQVTLRTKQL